MSAADHDVEPGDSQDEVCKCGHLHAEHYGKVATARCTVCEGPARPVEDREPVGPYAPTRTPNLDDRAAAAPERFEAGYRQGWRERHVYGTPRYKGLPTLTNRPEGGTELGDYLVEQFGSVGTRIDGLVDVVLGIGRQMTDNRVWASERFDRIDTALTKLTDLFVDSRDEIERTMTRPGYLRWKEGFDFGIKGFAEEMVTARRETREAFERGRQQGDADRAQRELATDEEMNAPISDQAQKNVREALKSAEEHRHRGYEAGFSGGKIVGAAEREAELLDQGWTPPGDKGERPNRQFTALDMLEQSGWTPPGNRPFLSIDTEDLEVTSGPTDYKVWRDALSMATEWASMHGRDPELNEIPGFAFWFHGQLMAGYDGARADEEMTRVTEREAAADLPAKETPSAEADYPF